MTWDVIQGLLRHLLTFGGGLVVTRGYFDEGTMQQIIGAVLTIGGVVWSMFVKKTSIMAASVAVRDGVEQVKVTPDMKAAIGSVPGVVATKT